MPSINDFLKGFSDGLPGMKDFQHASRLYIDDNFKLLPKQKFLFHVVFTIDNTIPARPFSNEERLELNMLVKSCELPKYDMNLEEKLQYNKKVYVGTRIKYNPVNIVFHDDHADTVNAFWKSYYEYNIADSLSVNNTGIVDIAKDDMYKKNRSATQFGMDNAQKRGKPFLKSVQIFVLHKKTFTGFTLVNPIIGSFSHDNLDQTDGGGLMTNTMQLFYETVLYSAGRVDGVSVPGFATLHYDKEPSPLSVLGRGTTSIFGPGGIVDGIGSVIGDVSKGNISLGTILTGINTYNNAKKINAKQAVKEELKGIVKEGVIDIGKQAGTITNPVGSFSIGTVAVAGAAAYAALAGSKSLSDGKNPNNRIISNPILNTQLYLTPTESFNLIQSNLVARDKVAAGIYYKLVGSRKGLTITQSEVEYAATTNDVKNVYRNRALTDTTKLVSDGFIKIDRQGNDVGIVAERAGL